MWFDGDNATGIIVDHTSADYLLVCAVVVLVCCGTCKSHGYGMRQKKTTTKWQS